MGNRFGVLKKGCAFTGFTGKNGFTGLIEHVDQSRIYPMNPESKLYGLGVIILSATGTPPKIIAMVGELRSHEWLLNRLNQALASKDFSLTVIFPTLSLLHFIQNELLNQPGVAGIGGVRFFLFEGFIEETAERFGLNWRQPSMLERNLLIARSFEKLAAEGKMDYLNRVPFGASYRQAILQGIAEWKRSGLNPEIFKQWAGTLGEKERELALLFENYQELLAGYGLVEADIILRELQEKSGQVVHGKPSPVLLYGFTDLTSLQQAFMNVLSGTFDFQIILDPTRVAEFRELNTRFFHIATDIGMGEPDGNEAVMEGRHFGKTEPPSALRRLQDQFWSGEPERISLEPGDPSLGLIQAAGLIRQTTGIAREVAGLRKADPTLDFDDFLILTPDPAGFMRTAAPVFREYQLSLSEPKRPILEFPWVNQFTNLLAAAGTGWQWPDMEVIIRQYYREEKQTGDRLLFLMSERYGAVSGRERWLKLAGGDSFRQYFLESGINLEPLEEAIGHLAAIPPRATLIDYLKAAREIMAGYNWPGEIKIHHSSTTDDYIREAELERLLNLRAIQLIRRSMDQWLAFLEKGPVTEKIPITAEQYPASQTGIEIQDFARLVNDYLLACSGLEVEPPELGQPGIRVLPPREARGLKARIVFIAGLEQGVFPRNYVHDWKVDATGRFELKKMGVGLETGVYYHIQEKLAFFWAMQSATNRLYLVYQDQDSSGQPKNRSMFLDEVLEWVPDLVARLQHYPLAPSLPENLEQCFSDYEIQSFTARFTSLNPAGFAMEDCLRCQQLLQLPTYRQLIGRIQSRLARRAGLKAPLFANPASLQWIAKMSGPEHVFAITALEDYRSCPYRYFWKRILNVQPLLKPELAPSAVDLGDLYHQILESFGDTYRDGCLQPDNITNYRQLLDDYFRSFYREWRENAATDLAQLMLLLQENLIRRNLMRWLESEIQWTLATQGRFHIKYLELAFGMVKGDYDPASLSQPFQLGEGREPIKLWGKIDRVDVDREGRFVIYDYKSGRGPSSKQIIKAEYLQLPVYIMALEQLLFGPGTTAGGSYLGLKAPSRYRGGVWRQSQMPAVTGAGVLDEAQWTHWLNEVQRIITGTVQAIRSGEFHQVGEDCFPFCEFRDVCRRPEWEVDPAHGQSVESATN
jgi:ATP-dependent helicase/DNAse subunit B